MYQFHIVDVDLITNVSPWFGPISPANECTQTLKQRTAQKVMDTFSRFSSVKLKTNRENQRLAIISTD